MDERTEAADTLYRLNLKLLRRIEKITDEAPDGAVTEAQYKAGTRSGVYKLTDLVTSYNNVTGRSSEDHGTLTIIDLDK